MDTRREYERHDDFDEMTDFAESMKALGVEIRGLPSLLKLCFMMPGEIRVPDSKVIVHRLPQRPNTRMGPTGRLKAVGLACKAQPHMGAH